MNIILSDLNIGKENSAAFIHLFHTLSTYCVPGAILDAWDIPVTKRENRYPMKLTFL